MKVVVKTTASHSSILEKILKRAFPSTESVMDLVKELNFQLPMIHEQEFKDLNKKISPQLDGKPNEAFDQEFRDNLVTVLRKKNGKLLVDSVKGICGFLFADELARHYSFKGRKGKRSFQTYEISAIITDALLALHPKHDKPQCEEKVAWWLGHANERLRLKNEKLQKQNEIDVEDMEDEEDVEEENQMEVNEG
nr:PREDICTED: uncharacterized protein LOC109041703 [Bemisia tabaci]